MTIFQSLPLLPDDPILGLNAEYLKDTRPEKVNLGVGVYYDAQSRIPLLNIIQTVENELIKQKLPRGYIAMDGLPEYNEATKRYLLGNDERILSRTVTTQSIGGTGALFLGAKLLYQVNPKAHVYVSNPTWSNHNTLFEHTGFKVSHYRYYNPETKGLDFNGMIEDLKQMNEGDIVLMHACCHNPTGIDPTKEQWQIIANTLKEKKLIPFLDIAYQGFGENTQEDAYAIHLLASMGFVFCISSSFSKSFALYGERIGALTVICADTEEAVRIQSQTKALVRAIYSNPPIHGARLVAGVLNNSEYYKRWELELQGMRTRIQTMRNQLADQLNEKQNKIDFSFIKQQQGMFSFTGLSAQQVDKMKEDSAIYLVRNGRICIAALNPNNIDYVVDAICKVL